MGTRQYVSDKISIPELRAAVKGRVLTPEDAGYDEARAVFYGGFDRRPAAIVKVADGADVSRVVLLARESGVELAVRAGGHSGAGYGVSDGGIVIDLRDLKALDIDVENRTAWAGGGLTAGEYTAEAGKHGLATGFGDTGTVGIGGITLGGGVGFLVRKYGLTIDDLLAAEVVTADGQLLHVDDEHHPDLFWAIRGGGGNFGVVTRFKFRLHPVDQVVGGMLILPATPEVISGFVAAADAAPEELSTIANVMSAPPMPFLPPQVHGKLIVLALMVYAGPVEEAERVLRPFRALAEPLVDMLRPIRYPEMYQPEDESYHPMAVGYNMFLDRFDDEAARTILEYIQASDAVMRVAQLRVLGGAYARVPADASAFAHRERRIMANLAAFYNGPEDRAPKVAWLRDFAAALEQGTPGAYVNFMDESGEEHARRAYPGSTWERLREIKARYDPDNLFRLNQNIPPAG